VEINTVTDQSRAELPLRAKVASSLSKTAAALSRAAGRGDGSVIGGWLGMKIDPDLLRHLAAGRRVALVSGTERQDHDDPPDHGRHGRAG
jgi:hypothetical protein